MVSSKSILTVLDNTGVRYVKCLKVLKTKSASGKKTIGLCGDIILVSVRITRPSIKIKKGQMFFALIVNSVAKAKRIYGRISFSKNAVILLNKKNEPLGNRIAGPLSRSSLESNFVKFESIRVRDI